MFCEDLGELGGESGKEVQERGDICACVCVYIYIYIYLILFIVWQKLTQYCKATVPQFLKKLKQIKGKQKPKEKKER